ncbi:MAG: radical SAM family heme chaperone HemW [Ruminococcus sp.]|nr:radical SAM family heme chaperone HemW [Ruminococcus sp.]
MSDTIGLYIHIPFCRSKCPYCDFFSLRGNESDYSSYVELLKSKIEIWGKKIKKKVDTIYFGGGTPSVLGAEYICDVLSYIKNYFEVYDDAEITLEVNPASGKFFDFAAVKKHGVNRISLGLQSANDNELKLLGRIHSIDDVNNTLSLIKNSGIDNISLDLMLGIPEQTKESLKRSIDFCAESGVTHISSYILKIEDGTIFDKRREQYKFPDEDTTADLYLFAVEYLSAKGFKQYEISNFSQSGFESRHNLKYWNLDDYLGIGPAAHSCVDEKRFYYNRSIENFKNDVIVDDGTGATSEEYILLQLRLSKGINIEKYKEVYGESLPTDFYKKIDKYCKLGLMNQDKNSVSFTPRGFLVSNSIIADLI